MSYAKIKQSRIIRINNYYIDTHRFDTLVFQEEFAQLFKQLDALRDKNLRLGNRQLADKIAAMQEVSTRGVWSTDMDKKSTIGSTAGSYMFTNHHIDCDHLTGGSSQKSLVINQNGKKPFMKEVTV